MEQTTEENQKEIYRDGHIKLQKVLAAIGSASKDSSNTYFGQGYASLSACNAAVKPHLFKEDLSLMQSCKPSDDGQSTFVITFVSYKGVDLATSALKIPQHTDMQKLGSAITYARRYTLCSLFNLDVEDDDGNASSNPQEGSKPSEKQINYMVTIAKERNIDIREYFNIKTRDELTKKQVSDFISKHK